MSDKSIFIDTNVFVYAKLKTDAAKQKHQLAVERLRTLGAPAVVSTQVFVEFASVLLKNQIAEEQVRQAVQDIATDSHVTPVTLNTVERAWNLKLRYRYSYWDSLILAAALEAECTLLWTEDLQHGQVILDVLTVENPFVA
ncbi:MAG: PIN domain-containing protein [Anaerolineales bacterium]